MTYKFNYPDNLSPLLELQVKSIESTANRFILQKPKERRERLIQLFQKEIDTLIKKTKIGEQKKEENLRRINKQRELKETLLKKDKLRKQKKKEAEEARLKEEKKLRGEKERIEARERVKEWDRNELKFYSGLIVTPILIFLFFNFITLILIFAAAYFYTCIDYSFFKHPRPNFSSYRGPTEIKVNLPTHQIEDSIKNAIITSLYQPGFTSRTSESISRGIEDALKNMKYK